MIKYRIGILGTENSHASNFAKYINLPDEQGNYRYPDCRVVCIYGHYPESNQKIASEYHIDCIAETIDEMLDMVDAVMVTARDGKYHLEFAKKFIEAGKPAFIDKPFTVDPSEAIELIKTAKEKGVSLNGGSTLKYATDVVEFKKLIDEQGVLNGSVYAPIHLNSPYSGFYFYASHLVEITLAAFGYDPVSVTAQRHENSVTATVNYENFSVTNHFSEHIYDYAIVACTQSGVSFKRIDTSDCSIKECDSFINMLHTGEMFNTYQQLLIPVFCMNAIEKAYQTGEKVTIELGETL